MNIYDFKVLNGLGQEISLSDYKDKVLLIINSATKCGFTPQYDELQDLYEKYEEDGFVILDFPCNQFGNQAPGTYEEIYNFCSSTFDITFPMFSKVDVNGENAHPLFKYLVSQRGFNGFNPEHELTPVLTDMFKKQDPDFDKKPDIKWNFTKFLIDRDGNVIERFEPTEAIGVIDKKVAELL